MKLKKRLTHKQAKLAAEKVKDPEASLSELSRRSAYHDKGTTKRELDKPHVQERIRDLMNQNPKLRLKALSKKLEEGLDATKMQRLVADKQVEEFEDVDYPTRKSYLDLALKLQGVDDKTAGGGEDVDEEVLDAIGVERLEKIIIERITRITQARKRSNPGGGV